VTERVVGRETERERGKNAEEAIVNSFTFCNFCCGFQLVCIPINWNTGIAIPRLNNELNHTTNNNAKQTHTHWGRHQYRLSVIVKKCHFHYPSFFFIIFVSQSMDKDCGISLPASSLPLANCDSLFFAHFTNQWTFLIWLDQNFHFDFVLSWGFQENSLALAHTHTRSGFRKPKFFHFRKLTARQMRLVGGDLISQPS